MNRAITVGMNGQRTELRLAAKVGLVLFFLLLLPPAKAAGLQQLRNIVPPTITHLQPVDRLAGSNHLDVIVSLPLRSKR
jgi:hypothetical protein